MICEPAAVAPFKRARRESLTRFVITCDMNCSSWFGKFPQTHQRNDHFFEAELRVSKIIHHAAERRTIRGSFHPPGHVPEVLLDHALLALRAPGQYRTKLR